MKSHLIVPLIFFSIVIFNQEYIWKDFDEKDGVIYKKLSDDSLAGRVYGCDKGECDWRL